MKKPLRQYHIGHLHRPPQTIDLVWDIINICNYQCSYCFMRLNDANWNNLGNWQKQQDIIATLEKTEVPINVWLLGGEPTLHPKFGMLVTMLHDSLIKASVDFTIKIISNNTKPEVICELSAAVKSKLDVVLSFHAEDADVDTFINNITLLKDSGITSITADIMMHYDKQYLPKIKSVFEKVSTLDIKISISYISINNKPVKYQKFIYDEFKDAFKNAPTPFVFEYEDETVEYSDVMLYNIIKEGKTNFQGMSCDITRFMMNINGKVTRSCLDDKFDLRDIIKQDFNKTVICPKTACISDCTLNYVKKQ